MYTYGKPERQVGALVEGWEPCSRPRFAVELGLPEKSVPTWLSGFTGLAASMKTRFFVVSPIVAFFLSFPIAAPLPWQSSCNPARSRAAEMLFNQDKLIEADSVYSVLESECLLAPPDLLRWMRIKAVVGQFSEAGRIACMAVRYQADVASLVQEQLTNLIKEAGIDTIRSVLRSYCSCVLSSRQQDTAAVRRWISGAYNRFKLFDEEAEALLKLNSKNYPSANDLFNGAQRRFSQGLFGGAIQLALSAYPCLKNQTSKMSCALLLYQSYAQLGRNDSAGLWLQEIPMTRPDHKARVIVFFQQTGLASKADSLLSTLPQSLARDTLTLRQKIFSADFKGAAALAGRLAGSYSGDRWKNELLLWRIRSLVFSGRGIEAEELMDSVEFFPAMNGAEEFLSYKYHCAVLKKSPRAWSVFGEVAYASWLMHPDKAFQALMKTDLDDCDPEVRQAIVLDGVRTLMSCRRFADARTIMERWGFSSAGNEFRYYYGEVLYNGGAVDSARKVLQELLLAHPGDVFSEKARIFLLRMDDPREGGHYGDTVDEKRAY